MIDAPLVLGPHLLGALPSPPDPHDFPAEPLFDMAAPLPPKQKLSLLAPVLNQGDTGRCVSFSLTGLRQQQERAGGDWPKGWPSLDPEWLYLEAGGSSNNQRGLVIRNALDVLLKQGQPLVAQGASAPNFRIASYHAVPFTVDAIKRALVSVGPVEIGTYWFTNWFTPHKGVLPSPIGPAIGGHGRFIYGWDDTVAGGAFLVRNSWGRGWGSNGNSYDPYGPLLRAMHDAWVCVDVKGDAPK